jgi:hypothetical protein
VAETAHYQVFGLRVHSEIPLPELLPSEGQALPQVIIRLAKFKPWVVDPGLHADGEALLLNIPDVGRYRIQGGNEILVDASAGVPDRNVRLFLLGSAFGALLHQRGLLPLHANAVNINGKAVAFMGPSGYGKSTLAAWFHQQGYDVIADDVCVVGFGEDGRPYATPGLPRLRLWAEALQLLGCSTTDYDRSYMSSDEQVDKFDVPIDPASVARSNVELGALYLLERGEKFSIDEIRGIEAAETLFANTYRGSYLSKVNGQKNHWQSAVRLVGRTPVYRAVREWDLAKLNEQCRRLLEHAEETVASERYGLY